MPDPARVNEVREELKAAQPSATAEERELHKADGQPVGVAVVAVDKNSAQYIAEQSGTRIWNHWDDATAAEIQTAAGERALSPEESEDVVGDPTKPARTTTVGVQPEGITGPTGATGSTGATGTTGATGASDANARRREAEQLEKAKNDRTEREKQTAKSGV